MRTLCLLHTQGCAAAHKHAKYKKLKDYNEKKLLLCRLHKYKNAYMS